MPKDKDDAQVNAHERLPAHRPDENDDAARRVEKEKRNPLSDLRFGSAGSGGAEREPGPERP